MRRQLNVKLLAGVLGVLLIVSIAVHFLHGYQVDRNAYRLLERAERALEAKDDDKALFYFGQYLALVPGDVDTVQKYVHVLDRRASTDAEIVNVILLMEKVLRAKPNEQELRLRLVHYQIALDRFAEALANLKALEKQSSDKAEVLHMIGWCQDAMKKYAEAAQSFEAAIHLKPTQIKSYALLAEVLNDRLHQPEEAQKAMDDLVRANPEKPEVYLLRARFTRRRGDEKGAESDLQTALKLAPDRPAVILEAADGARARSNWAEATKLLQDGLKRFPEHADFYRAMALVNIRNEKGADALATVKEGLRRTPKSLELGVLYVDLLIDQKQNAEARARIDELIKMDVRSALASYLKARLAVADGQWSEALRLLESARPDLAGSDWSSRLHVLLGLSYRQLGDRERELQSLRRAVNDEPTWMTASVEFGAALINNGRLDEAGQALEPLKSAKDLPAGYWVLLSRARLHRQVRLPAAERRWELIEEALDQAVKAAPKSTEPAIVRAEMHFARGDFAAAKTILEKCQAEHPADIALTCALADLAARQGRWDEAEKILGQADDGIAVRVAQCRLWGARGSAEARAKLARLAETPANRFTLEERVRLWRDLADTWQRLGESPRAEAIWSDIARALPKDLRSRSSLLDLALQKNQLNSAGAWLEEIRAIEGPQGWLGRYGEVALLMQQAHGNRSQLDEARRKLDELDKAHKNLPRVALLSAVLSEMEGKPTQAIEDFVRALEFGETQPRVLANVLVLLIERREFARAEIELTRYEQKQPLTPQLSRLGAEVALGMRDRTYARLARKRAEQAVGAAPRNYRDALWLARFQDAAGDHADAEKLLQASLDQAGHTPETWIAWMEHLQQTNQRQHGVQDFERLKKELPTARQALTIARCYEALQMPEEADKSYQEALRQAPDDCVALAYAADFYRRADRDKQAQDCFECLLDPALAAPAEYAAAARHQLAILLAPRDAKRALTLVDGNAVADQRIRWFIQGLTPSAAKDSLKKFNDSLRQQPATPDERLLLARMLESANKLAEARAQLSDLADENSTACQYLAAYARLLIRMNELDDAQRVITRLETLESASERVRNLRTELARAKKL